MSAGFGDYQRRMCKPITVRGVEYPSRAAAARAFGVTPGAIYHAVRNGREDFVGTRQSTDEEDS